MNGDKRDFSLSIWDHKDNFLCILKSANNDFEGQSYNEQYSENVNGEKTLTFSIPMYISKYDIDENRLVLSQNPVWKQIYNEQKIRYTEYNPITNKPEKIEEFVLKEHVESRNGEQKIADCTCESLAIYELGKVGSNIVFDTDYITNYELGSHMQGTITVSNCPDLLTIDYWLKKIFYKETNLGRVSTTTECTYLLQGLQLRDDEGYPIKNSYSINTDKEYEYVHTDEPIADENKLEQYRNDDGWTWEIQATFENDPEKQGISTLYESPVINKFIQVTSNYFIPQSYQKEIGADDSTKELRRHPIEDNELNKYTYVTDIKKRLITVERSNVFSIIQDLCEKFEVWAHFNYEYDLNNGKIIGRKIIFKTESIDENIKFDFSYGKNLQSCSRTNNSNDLITKLIVTDTESNLVEGNLLSIRQATANPTSENYIYNFDYFYDSGMLTKEKQFSIQNIQDSDEYRINTHCGKIRGLNNRIVNLQQYLLPFYNRKLELESQLIVQQGSRTGYMDNIQEIQEKIDAIPSNQQLISSWSFDSHQNNHVGELKTYSVTTLINGNEVFYLNFGREDILVKDIDVIKYSINDEEILEKSSVTTKLQGFIPRSLIVNVQQVAATRQEEVREIAEQEGRNFDSSEAIFETTFGGSYVRINNGEYYVSESELQDLETRMAEETPTTPEGENIVSITTFIWSTAMSAVPDNDPDDGGFNYFQKFEEFGNKDQDSNNFCEYDYSPLGNKQFIKGIYFNKKDQTNGRIRYRYAPLAYYYLLIKDYWDKLVQVEAEIKEIEKNLLEIKNQIVVYELTLKNLLNQKNELILQFEKEYKPFIREGYWEPGEYESQLNTTVFDTNNGDNFNNLYIESTYLKDLHLNEGDSKYSYFVDLGPADNILIDTISMITLNATEQIEVPRYKGHDFELYLRDNNNLILAISPDLIDTYNNNLINTYTYSGKISYTDKNGDVISSTTEWNNNIDNVIVIDPCIYLSNDNILTDRMKVYGGSISPENELELYKDYNYTYESSGYNKQGQRIDLSKQESYNTDIKYDYSLKIQFKLTDTTIDYIVNNKHFFVEYAEETTLQYFYNDAVETSKKYSIPQVEYSISVIDLSHLNEFKDYKPKLGQKVPINDIEMGFNNFEGFITSISYLLEEKYNTQITIATYKTKFEDVFQKLTATMSDISYNSNSIYKAAESFDLDGTIKTDVFRKSLEDNFNRIELGTDNDISIDKVTGITLQDNNTGSAIKLLGNGIFLTEDATQGNKTVWRTGITGEGINANAIKVGNIDTKQISLWNASEGQVRFVWNDQGLVAYGDKLGNRTLITDNVTNKDAIDYKKYVKFNQNGLEFSDHEKSALTLGWTGLKIQTQSNALQLNADDGLILKEGTTTRLELGKLDKGSLYGLRLRTRDNTISFQSDSYGDLWLQRHIRLGGSINSNNNVINPTAGIYGSKDSVPIEMQMGLRRGSDGNFIWDSNPIRFWAGPQTKDSYTTFLHINNLNSLSTEIKNKFNNLVDNNSPSLAKFKVSSAGDIIASGIDVGGWIGEGDKLRSNDNEALLRSNGYLGISNENYPLIAIGKSNKNPDTTFGSNYNFRVYKDGTLNIGNDQFIATSTGKVTAKNMTIIGGNVSISTGNVGGLVISESSLIFTSTFTKSGISYTYQTAIYSRTGTTDNVFEAGLIKTNNTNQIPSFRVTGEGKLYATAGEIAGWTINNTALSIGGSNYYVALTKATAKSTKVIQAGTAANTIKFSVTADGEVEATNFKIHSDSNNNFYTGTRSASVSTDITFYAGTKKKDDDLDQNEFYVRADGYIKASFGKIGGWSLSNDSLYNDKSTSTDNNDGIYIGTDAIALGKNGIFVVTKKGEVTAKNITIEGTGNTISGGKIGGLTINSNSLIFTKEVYNKTTSITTTYEAGIYSDNLNTVNPVFKAGKVKTQTTTETIIETPSFIVTGRGALNASSGNIAGWSLSNVQIYSTTTINNVTNYVGMRISSSPTNNVFYAGTKGNNANTQNEFRVTGDGTLTATKAIITGDITANTGYIGGSQGFTIKREDDISKIYSGSKSSLTADEFGVYIGTDGISLGKHISESTKISKFQVNNNGSVTASDINIVSGKAANLTITDRALEFETKTSSYSNKNNINTTTVTYYKTAIQTWGGPLDSRYAFQSGVYQIDTIKDGISTRVTPEPTFSVASTGKIRATAGEIAGWDIDDTRIYKSVASGSKYYVGMRVPSEQTDNVFYAGTHGEYSNADNEFYVKANGELHAVGAKIDGSITTKSGYISGFTIADGKIYSGSKSSLTANKAGVYIGTDGIALGTIAGDHSKFQVANNGNVFANNITIDGGNVGGFSVSTDELKFETKRSSYNNNVNTTTVTYYRTAIKNFVTPSDSNYAFQSGVYQTDTIKNGVTTTDTQEPTFFVASNGKIHATAGKIAGWTINNSYIFKNVSISSNGTTITYYTGMRVPTTSTQNVFYAGTKGSGVNADNEFYVKANGEIKASSGKIGGWNLADSMLYKDPGSNLRIGIYSDFATTTGLNSGTSTEPIIYIGNKNNYRSNNNNTKFKVSSDGSVFFHGGIYGWSENKRAFKKGLTAGNINKLYTSDGKSIDVEICQGLIIDISET